MNEKKINELIDSVSSLPDGASFEGVKEKIEAQTSEQREQCRQETLEMLGSSKKRSIKSAKWALSFAAAVLAVIGLGTAFIAISIGSAANDASSSESLAMDTWTRSDESCMESAVESPDSDENGYNSGALADEGSESVSQSPLTDTDGCVSFTVEALDLSIDLPAQAYITGRNVSRDFELLDVYGMSAAELEASYKMRNIYANAVWYDSDADATEIIIKMTRDETSEEIFDLSSAHEEQLERIRSLYLDYENGSSAITGAYYSDVTMIENEQALFFCAEGVVDNRSGRSNHLQYMTIINGCRIEITLIEHFGVDSELTGDEPQEVSRTHKEIMERVIRSVRWDKVRSKFWHQNRGTVFYASIALIGLIAIITVLLLPENRRKNKRPEVVTSEPEQTENENDHIDDETQKIMNDETQEIEQKEEDS